jgi:hypothetical protein
MCYTEPVWYLIALVGGIAIGIGTSWLWTLTK